jgi:hypothetical protein
MKINTTRKVIVLALFFIPVIFSALLSINLNVSVAAQENDYVVGGTIIPTNNLLGPWVAIMAVLALIAVTVYRKGKNIPNM